MRTTFVDELYRTLYVAFLAFTHLFHFVLDLISLFISQRFKNRLFYCYQVYFYMEMAMGIWLQAKYIYIFRSLSISWKSKVRQQIWVNRLWPFACANVESHFLVWIYHAKLSFVCCLTQRRTKLWYESNIPQRFNIHEIWKTASETVVVRLQIFYGS